MTKPQLPNLQQTVANTIFITNISNSYNFNKFWVAIFTSIRFTKRQSVSAVSESVSNKHTSCRKVTQSFSNPEHCWGDFLRSRPNKKNDGKSKYHSNKSFDLWLSLTNGSLWHINHWPSWMGPHFWTTVVLKISMSHSDISFFHLSGTFLYPKGPFAPQPLQIAYEKICMPLYLTNLSNGESPLCSFINDFWILYRLPNMPASLCDMSLLIQYSEKMAFGRGIKVCLISGYCY